MSEQTPLNTSAEPAEGPAVGRGRRRIWVSLIGVLLGLGGGLAAYMLQSPVYEAAAFLHIYERQPYVVFPPDLPAQPDHLVQRQFALIHSPMVLAQVLRNPEIARLEDIEREEDASTWLSDRLKVTQIGQSEFYRVTFACSDPAVSVLVLNAVVNRYFELIEQEDSSHNMRVVSRGLTGGQFRGARGPG